jgi:hypothetical protein
MKETVKLKLNPNLEISVKGIYAPEVPEIMYHRNGDPGEPSTPAEYIIDDIEIEKGNITDLVEWCNDMLNEQCGMYKRNKDRKYHEDIWFILENLCIEQLEKY